VESAPRTGSEAGEDDDDGGLKPADGTSGKSAFADCHADITCIKRKFTDVTVLSQPV